MRQATVPACPGAARASVAPGVDGVAVVATHNYPALTGSLRASDGRLLSRAQAFLALWAALPGWRWLAVTGCVPGAAWAMERVYRMFLRLRPLLQRWAARLDRPA